MSAEPASSPVTLRQSTSSKRLAVNDDTAPLFNDLLCYFTYVGGWRDMDPSKVVSCKRSLDKKIHLAAPLFTAEFFRACMDRSFASALSVAGAVMHCFVFDCAKARIAPRLEGRVAVVFCQ